MSPPPPPPPTIPSVTRPVCHRKNERKRKKKKKKTESKRENLNMTILHYRVLVLVDLVNDQVQIHTPVNLYVSVLSDLDNLHPRPVHAGKILKSLLHKLCTTEQSKRIITACIKQIIAKVYIYIYIYFIYFFFFLIKKVGGGGNENFRNV